jgi:hypothetical protein
MYRYPGIQNFFFQLTDIKSEEQCSVQTTNYIHICSQTKNYIFSVLLLPVPKVSVKYIKCPETNTGTDSVLHYCKNQIKNCYY